VSKERTMLNLERSTAWRMYISALEALHNVLYNCSTYLFTYLYSVFRLCWSFEDRSMSKLILGETRYNVKKMFWNLLPMCVEINEMLVQLLAWPQEEIQWIRTSWAKFVQSLCWTVLSESCLGCTVESGNWNRARIQFPMPDIYSSM